MKPEPFARKCVRKAEEDELVMLAKIRNSRDWQKFVNTCGADYLLALLIPNEDERERKKDELMKIFQKQATVEINRRKIAELKKDEKRRKQNLQRRLEKYDELRKENKIKIWSRRKAQINFQNDGSFHHHCPGWFTDRSGQTQRCQEIHKISLITEEELVSVTQPFLTTILDKQSGKHVLATPRLGPKIGTGSMMPILDAIMNDREEMLVIRCGGCNTTDDLKITLEKE